MVVRSAVGALCAVAVLGAVAMALPERSNPKSATESKAPQFGALTKASFVPPDGADHAAGEDRSKLLKLASLTVAQGQPTPAAPQSAPAVPQNSAAAASATPVAAQAAAPAAVPAPAVTAAPVSPAPAAVAIAAPATRGIDLPSSGPAPKSAPVVEAKADEPEAAASEPEPAVAPAPQARGKSKSGAVDINRASEDALDHLPGGGRIGHSIVAHRPYRSIEDLLHKRVLRLSAYQRIQNAIKVD